jgi:G3E family GTPase
MVQVLQPTKQLCAAYHSSSTCNAQPNCILPAPDLSDLRSMTIFCSAPFTRSGCWIWRFSKSWAGVVRSKETYQLATQTDRLSSCPFPPFFCSPPFYCCLQRPFHPQRLLDLALSQSWAGVLRSKGFCWVATRHDVMGLWQSAGGAWQGEPR